MTDRISGVLSFLQEELGTPTGTQSPTTFNQSGLLDAITGPATPPAPVAAPARPPSIPGEFAEGLSAGVQRLGPLATAGAATVLDIFGADDIALDMLNFATETEEEIARNHPVSVTFDEAFSSPGNFARFALRNLGEQVPVVASIIMGGGVGGLVGRLVGRGALTAAEGTAGLSRFGIMTGAIGTATGIETGATASELFEATGEMKPAAAFSAGIAKGALEAIVPLAFARRFGLGAGETKTILDKAISALDNISTRKGRIGAAFVGGGVIEGATEFLQEAVDIAVRDYVDENFDALDPSTRSRLLESAFVGALVGSIFGGIGGAVGGKPSAQERLIEGQLPRGDERAGETGATPQPTPTPAAPLNEDGSLADPEPELPGVTTPQVGDQPQLPLDGPAVLPGVTPATNPPVVSKPPPPGQLTPGAPVDDGPVPPSFQSTPEEDTLPPVNRVELSEVTEQELGEVLNDAGLVGLEEEGIITDEDSQAALNGFVLDGDTMIPADEDFVASVVANADPQFEANIIEQAQRQHERYKAFIEVSRIPSLEEIQVEAAIREKTTPSNNMGVHGLLIADFGDTLKDQDGTLSQVLRRMTWKKFDAFVRAFPEKASFRPGTTVEQKRAVLKDLKVLFRRSSGANAHLGASSASKRLMANIRRNGLIVKVSDPSLLRYIENKHRRTDEEAEVVWRRNNTTTTGKSGEVGLGYTQDIHEAGTAKLVWPEGFTPPQDALSPRAFKALRQFEAGATKLLKLFGLNEERLAISVDGIMLDGYMHPLDANAAGAHTSISKNVSSIIIKELLLEDVANNSPGAVVELATVLTHEFGHLLVWRRFSHAEPAVQLKIIQAFHRAQQKALLGNMEDFTTALRSPDSAMFFLGQGTPSNSPLRNDMINQNPEYFFGFSEFMAEQVAKYFNVVDGTGNSEALTFVDKIFKNLAKQVRAMYRVIANHFNISPGEFKPENNVNAWIESLLDSADSGVLGKKRKGINEAVNETIDINAAALGEDVQEGKIIDVYIDPLGSTRTEPVEVIVSPSKRDILKLLAKAERETPKATGPATLEESHLPGAGGGVRFAIHPDSRRLHIWMAFEAVHDDMARPLKLPAIGPDTGFMRRDETSPDGFVVESGFRGTEALGFDKHILRYSDIASKPVTAGTPDGEIGFRQEQMLGKFLPKKKAASVKAGVARINWLQKWGYTLRQLTLRNPFINGLKRYNELMDAWNNAATVWKSRADETIKGWRALGKKSQDNLAKFIFSIDSMEYLGKDEQPRLPTDEELLSMAKKHKMTEEAYAVYQQVRSDLNAFISKIEEIAIRDAKRTIQNDISLMLRIAEIEKEFAILRNRPYFPHSRFGDFSVVVKRKNGQTAHFEQFKSRKEALEASKAIQAQFGPEKGFSVRVDKIPEEMKPFRGLPPTLLNKMKTMPGLSEQQRIWIDQLVLELSPTQSFRKRLSRRADIPGYSLDAMRSYANYFWHGSNYLARLEFQQPLQESIDSVHAEASDPELSAGRDVTKTREIADFMQNHFDQIMNPGPDWAQVRSLAFVWWLGFLPQSAAVNLTQIPMVSLPYLGSRFGDVKAVSAIKKGYGDFIRIFRMKTDNVSDDFLEALSRAVEKGVVDESYAAELAATAEGGNLAALIPGNKAQRGLAQVSHWGAWMFQNTEKINRRVVFSAAWNLAERDPGNAFLQELKELNTLEFNELLSDGFTNEQALSYLAGRDAVWSTQFQYSNHARPRFIRGRKGVIFTFFTFLQSMVHFAAHDRARTRFFLMMFLFAGVMGLPGADDFNAFVRFASRKLLGEDVNLEMEMRKMIVNMADGDIDPDIILHGTSRVGFGMHAAADLAGIPFPEFDLSASLGLGRIIPGFKEAFGTQHKSFAANFAKIGQDVAGASLGIGINIWQALSDDELPFGDHKRWERAMPRALKSLVRANRFHTEGRERDRKGATFMEFDASDPDQLAEIIAQALGFTPTRMTRKWDRQRMEQEAVAFWTIRRGMLLKQFDHAMTVGDKDAVKDMGAAIKRYNNEVAIPGFTISGRELRQSQRERQRRRGLVEVGIPASKKQRALVHDVQRLFPEVESVEDFSRAR